MEDNIQLFEHEEFGEVRVVMIDGEPWFVGKDVATALGYTNPQKALRDHVPDKYKKVNDSFTLGQGSSPVLINEAGMYKLVMRSRTQQKSPLRRANLFPKLKKALDERNLY